MTLATLGDALPTRPTDTCRLCGTVRPADELTTAEDARGRVVGLVVCRADAPGPVACVDPRPESACVVTADTMDALAEAYRLRTPVTLEPAQVDVLVAQLGLPVERSRWE